MELKELCRECLLHNKNIHKCPFCDIDFNNQKSIVNAFRKLNKQHKILFANTTVRVNNNNIELFRTKEDYSVLGNHSKGPRTKKWYYDENNCLRKKSLEDERATVHNLELSRKKSLKRVLDCFLSYGQNNDWQYFITITFDPKKIDSTNQKSIKYAWKKFRQKLQYYYPDIKILSVIEYHEDNNKLHFHGAIGNALLGKILARAVNMERFRKNKDGSIKMRNGKPVLNEYYMKPLETIIGDKIYNFLSDFYDLGFCSIIPLTPRDNLTSFDKVIFYLSKYMNKDKSSVPYCSKSYFHTYNLKKGKKKTLHLSNEQFDKLLAELDGIQQKKDNDNFSSYVLNTKNGSSILDLINNYYDIPKVQLKEKTNEVSIKELEELDPIFIED